MIALEFNRTLRFFCFLRLKTRRRLPQSWNELAQGRRLSVFRALLNDNTGEALRLLLRLRKSTWRKISAEDKAAILALVPWLKAEPSAIPVFTSYDLRFTRWGRPNRFLLADPNFVNGSCMEFALADEFLGEFLGGNEKSLPLLTATLLRELDPDTAEAVKREDLRVRLNGRMEVELRAKRQKRLPQEVHMACLLYFVGVKQLVSRLYGEWLFQAPEEPDPETPNQKPVTEKGDPLGWWGMFMDAAGGDVQKLDAIQLSNLHNFCTMEVRRRKQAKEADMRSRMNAPDFGIQ